MFFKFRLTKNGIVKVADFGLAVDISHHKKKSQNKCHSQCEQCKNLRKNSLPIKWMALENLWQKNAYSTKSDVVSINFF